MVMGSDRDEAADLEAVAPRVILVVEDEILVRMLACDMTGAELKNADLTAADLRQAVFVGADLSRANFTGALLRQANFTDVVRHGARGLEDSI